MIRFIALSLLLTSTFNFSLSAKNTLKENALQGEVKKVISVDYLPIKALNDRMMRQSEIVLNFNSSGDVVEEYLKSADHNLVCSSAVTVKPKTKIQDYKEYDQYENITYHSISEIRDVDDVVVSRKYYNADCSMTSKLETQFNSDGSIDVMVLYDSKANVLAKKTFGYENKKLAYVQVQNDVLNGDWSSDWQEYYDYDNNGNHTLTRKLSADGHVLNLTEHIYTPQGRKIMSIFYPTFSTENFEKQEFSYDVNGQVIEAVYYDKNNNIYRNENFSRTFEGDLRAFAVYQPTRGNLTPDYIQSFDKNLNEIKCVSYDSKGNLFDYVETDYKYDEQNNWIEKVEKSGLEVVSMTKRTITYY